jgi:aspartate/methionine/tyrosine aminotransferase
MIMKSAPSKPTGLQPYLNVMRRLARMDGDVVGFINIDNKMTMGMDDAIMEYRSALKAKHRKDRVVVPSTADDTYVHSNDYDGTMLIRKLGNYRFQDKFDIAVCDGVVFVCRQMPDGIEVQEITDRVAYDAYRKLLTDLWIAADNNAAGRDSTKDINSTVSELHALLTPYNIADAHTHQQHSETQDVAIVQQLPKLWETSHYTEQTAIETAFLETLFRLRGCPTALTSGKNYINYSASSIIALISNFIRSNHLSISLISPCFDTLPDLLKDGGTLPLPISETLLHDPDRLYERLGAQVTTDALFIVNPNNPTGFCLDEFGEQGFRELARFCHNRGITLVIDLCFMLFICRDPAFEHIDCYKILDEYQVDYVTIEDTGKILPTMDTKAAVLHVSPGLVGKFERLHTNYILRHSPFVLQIATAFMEDGIASDLRTSYDLLATNRAYLKNSIRKHQLPLAIEERRAALSVAWLRISAKSLTADDVYNTARKHNIVLLPGDKFFWDDPSKGAQYLRIALAREQNVFQETVDALANVLRQLLQG